jgi:aminopeptidase N
VIPIKVGLFNPNGDEVVPTIMLEMTKAKQSFPFEGLAARNPCLRSCASFRRP